jgi:hypothetical protein
MNLHSIKEKLISKSIFLKDEKILGAPSAIGYEKKFKWSWLATQLNTFIVVSDFGNENITITLIEKHLSEAFTFATNNYNGWPRGLQSTVGVISILISNNITPDAKEYCKKLISGIKWAGFTIPVTIDSSTNERSYFENFPVWGKIYFPHFQKTILEITQ